nr:Fic family protein [Kaistia adipata]
MFSGQRHSRAAEAELLLDPIKKAEAEARNGLRQYDLAIRMAQEAIDRGQFKLRVSVVLSLQREALEGLSSYAGNFRPAGVEIEGSGHRPPEAHLVAELVEELCDYVNDNWADQTALHLASYVMWRLNWVHPFSDGNGRTSRILSYLVLCIKTGFVLPGTPTIPDQIVDNRAPYFAALDAADAAYASGQIDVSEMETLLGGLLAVQLMKFYEQAGGSLPNVATQTQ